MYTSPTRNELMSNEAWVRTLAARVEWWFDCIARGDLWPLWRAYVYEHTRGIPGTAGWRWEWEEER